MATGNERTLEVLAKSVEESTTGHSVVETDVGEQHAFEETCFRGLGLKQSATERIYVR